MKKILLVGGGTGWHVFPLLNLVHFLQKNNSSTSIWLDTRVKSEYDGNFLFHWIGENNSIESRVSWDNQIPFSPIICGKLRRYFSLQTLLLPFQILIGIVQSLWILLREKPAIIFSKGGYVSLPVAIAGWILHIRIYLHESDSVPGLANRIVGKFSSWIFCAFHEADGFFQSRKILGYGSLLSAEIQNIVTSSDGSPGQARGWRTQLLVSCGSQGSAAIFDAVIGLLPWFSDIDFHVILWVKNLDYREKFEKFSNVAMYDFFYNQSDYLKIVQRCDLVIARSGSSIFEFEALWLTMILIPHPYTGNNHQYWNAKAFEKKGQILLEQKNISDLASLVEGYKSYKKTPLSFVVDSSIYDTIYWLI